MLEQHDSALVIGDAALQVDRSRYITYDLAEEWIRFTGKPFVFAFWAVRKEALILSSDHNFPSIFQQSRDNGLKPENLNEIANDWAPRVHLTEADVKSYLTNNIYYDLDRECLDGLKLFYQYAGDCGTLPPRPNCGFWKPRTLQLFSCFLCNYVAAPVNCH